MLKSISRSICVLFFHFHLVHVPSNYVPRRSKVRQIQTLKCFRFLIVRLKTILLIELSWGDVGETLLMWLWRVRMPSLTIVDCSPFQHISGYCLLGTMFGNPFFHFKWWCQSKLNIWDVFGMYLKQFWSDQSFEICSWHLWRHNCCIDLLGTHMDKSCLDKSHVMIYFSLDFFFIL